MPTAWKGDRRYCSQICSDARWERRPCETCGEELVLRRGKYRRWCDATCRMQARTEARTCPGCGTTFTVKRTSKVTYCTKSCWLTTRAAEHAHTVADARAAASSATAHLGEATELTPRFSTCITCQSVFPSRYGENNLFCSWKCRRLPYCVACTVLIDAERRRGDRQFCSDTCRAAHRADPHVSDRIRRCWFCLRLRPRDEFMNGQGLRHRCADCAAVYRAGRRASYAARNAARRASLESRTIPFTAAQRAQRWEMWAGRCWICGISDASEEDHVKPVSKGGWHCLANLRPICGPCNSSKNDRWPLTEAERRPNFRHPNAHLGCDPGRPKVAIRIQLTCPTCGKEFSALPGDRGRTYCSPRCARISSRGEISPREDRTCLICGATFRVLASSRQQLCSVACRRVNQRRPLHEFTCERCGKVFARRSNRFRFCSKSCAVRTNTHTHTCAVCGSAFLGKNTRKFCSRRCAGIASHWPAPSPGTS
ncbi:HNH endonuclease [Trujillonella endophytica]|uniref:5-methylcytosine-specific restriction endonuclease McrA n=1 Tax=Trujillonella endophytica TaxID=673521 RepID=A0A1H8WPP2_9ACTN|nr:HNH endonuclease signature motif containing protein [Trujillella endophytica]SEP29621.1 5-methylcytosine-specific restriction endonuclease McrA [Trujillella endophytica]